MKKANEMKGSLHRVFLGAVALAGLLASGSINTSQAATLISPAGTWDCIVNGSQGVGLAYLTFSDDFTFSGYELLTTKPRVTPTPSTSSGGRNPGGDVGRYISTNYFGSSASSSTNLFGFGRVNGPWTYDLASGHVVGYFTQLVGSNTHSVGFWAKVIPNRKLWLVASTPNGKVVYNGVPISTSLPDLSGTWYAYNYHAGQKLVEFFDATPGSSPFSSM